MTEPAPKVFEYNPEDDTYILVTNISTYAIRLDRAYYRKVRHPDIPTWVFVPVVCADSKRGVLTITDAPNKLLLADLLTN